MVFKEFGEKKQGVIIYMFSYILCRYAFGLQVKIRFLIFEYTDLQLDDQFLL